MGAVTTVVGFGGLFLTLYLQVMSGTREAERPERRQSHEEEVQPQVPRFDWGLVYFYDGAHRSIYGKGHAYSGHYKIDGVVGANVYANMKVYFYGVENDELYEWNEPVIDGYLNSYSGTPNQEFGVSMIPPLSLICIEYDTGDGPERSVSAFMRDSMNSSDVFFTEAGPSVRYEAVTDVGCASSITRYVVDHGIMRKGEIQAIKVYGDHGNALQEQRYLAANAVSNMRNTLSISPTFSDDRYCAAVREVSVAGASNHSMLKLMSVSISSIADFGSYSCTDNYSSTPGLPPRVGAADKLSVTFRRDDWQTYLVSCTAISSDLPGMFNIRHDYFSHLVKGGLTKQGLFNQDIVDDKDYCRDPEKWPRPRS